MANNIFYATCGMQKNMILYTYKCCLFIYLFVLATATKMFASNGVFIAIEIAMSFCNKKRAAAPE